MIAYLNLSGSTSIDQSSTTLEDGHTAERSSLDQALVYLKDVTLDHRVVEDLNHMAGREDQ